MTYEEALQIAMEELYDAVEVLRRNNKGYEARIEKMCNRLLTARNVLCEALEDMEVDRLRAKKKQIYEDLKDAVDREDDESYDQTALELCERCGWKTLIPSDGCLNCNRREWVGLTEEEEDSIMRQCHMQGGAYLLLFRLVEAKLKEKNT